MRSILCLIGALLCCVLLSTCGTARVAADDYDTDIEFIDIMPDGGVSGEAVTFRPIITKNSGFEDDGDNNPATDDNYIWLWDFGGGAEPNKVYAKEAAVTLRDGLRGPYVGTLTVFEVNGGETEISYEVDFNFGVVPLEVLGVRPTRAVEGSEVTFSAIIGSGNITDYAWDFGGAGTPGGSNEVNPSVEITNGPGLYQCSVVVSNQFEVLEFPFTLVVDPAPVEEAP